jgi:hypothetical protein
VTRTLVWAVSLVLAGAAAAQTPGPASSPGPDWLPRTTAELQVLDKVSAHATPLTLKVGQAADNASLSITLRACMVRPPDREQDSAAYLDIQDSRPGAPGFHGWMFSNEPSLSMLEHPIYDVRLVSCHS